MGGGGSHIGPGGPVWGGGSHPWGGSDPSPSPPPPADIDVWNPAFDVTPHDLITGGIVTEWGVFAPGELRAALAARGH